MEKIFKDNEHKLEEMPSEVVWLRLQERIKTAEKRSSSKEKRLIIRHLWQKVSAAAAVVLLLLCSSIFFLRNSKQPPIALLDELSVPSANIESDVAYNIMKTKSLKDKKIKKLKEGSLEQKLRPSNE